jgi:hypothetical protein
MPAGPIEKETKHLDEEVDDWMSFGMLPNGAKEPVKMWVKIDPMQVTSKEMESASPVRQSDVTSTASMRRGLLNLDRDMDSSTS